MPRSLLCLAKLSANSRRRSSKAICCRCEMFVFALSNTSTRCDGICDLTSLSFALMKVSSRFGSGMNVVARGSDDVYAHQPPPAWACPDPSCGRLFPCGIH